MTDPKRMAESISARLKTLARNRDVPYQHVMTEFLIERIAERLSADEALANHLVFKGGYVGLKVYLSPRYTIDLDAMLVGKDINDAIKLARSAVEQDRPSSDGTWFRYESSAELTTQGEYGGIRLVFRGGLGEPLKNLTQAQILHLDMGIGDPVVPGPSSVTTPFVLGDGSLTWRVYPAESIASEKIHTLVIRGSANSRSKDIFDLAFLLPKCDSNILKEAIAQAFTFRGDPLPANFAALVEQLDQEILRRGWKNAVFSVKGNANFDEAFAQIVASLKRLRL